MPVSKDNKTARRAVIVAGNRTPFVKAFSEYLSLDTIALGVEAVGGLLAAPTHVNQYVERQWHPGRSQRDELRARGQMIKC